jgi:hypothetical protein
MTGTETAAAGGWLVSKLAPTIGGLFGGLSLAMFWTPEKLREKGKIASIFIAGGISAMAGFALTGLVAIKLNVDLDKIETIVGLSWFLGLGSIAVMNWFSNWIERREHLDIAEVGRDIKAARAGKASHIRKNPSSNPRAAKAPAVKKPAAKKAPPRKPTKAKA